MWVLGHRDDSNLLKPFWTEAETDRGREGSFTRMAEVWPAYKELRARQEDQQQLGHTPTKFLVHFLLTATDTRARDEVVRSSLCLASRSLSCLV